MYTTPYHHQANLNFESSWSCILSGATILTHQKIQYLENTLAVAKLTSLFLLISSKQSQESPKHIQLPPLLPSPQAVWPSPVAPPPHPPPTPHSSSCCLWQWSLNCVNLSSRLVQIGCSWVGFKPAVNCCGTYRLQSLIKWNRLSGIWHQNKSNYLWGEN